MPLLRYKRYRPNHAAVLVPAPGGGGSFTTWNNSDKGTNTSLDVTRLIYTNSSGSGAHSGVRAVASASSGKKFYQITATAQNFAAFSYFGIGTASADLNNFLGGDTAAAIMQGNGPFKINGATVGSGDGLGVTGHFMCIAADLDADLIWFYNSDSARWNGDILANQNPATGTGGFSLSTLASGPYFPIMSAYQQTDSFTANFGATAYSITAPSGFGNW